MHVGVVLPGFITTEGFPQAELNERALTRRLVSTPDRAAEAIYEAGIEEALGSRLSKAEIQSMDTVLGVLIERLAA